MSLLEIDEWFGCDSYDEVVHLYELSDIESIIEDYNKEKHEQNKPVKHCVYSCKEFDTKIEALEFQLYLEKKGISTGYYTKGESDEETN